MIFYYDRHSGPPEAEMRGAHRALFCLVVALRADCEMRSGLAMLSCEASFVIDMTEICSTFIWHKNSLEGCENLHIRILGYQGSSSLFSCCSSARPVDSINLFYHEQGNGLQPIQQLSMSTYSLVDIFEALNSLS